ncbi:MAG: F0F1 ATP synthase subunit B, partial [Acidimicrobiia bacterium]
MKMRKLLTVGLVTVAASFAVSGTAHAEDPGVHAGKELFECVEEAVSEFGADVKKDDVQGFTNAIEDCKKAPSLITPAVPEMIWGGLAFLIVLVLLTKFAFPALKKGVKAREEKIRSDLEGAERARQEAEEERTRYQALIADARNEANRLVEDARTAAEQVRQDLITRSEQEAAGIRSRANDDIQAARERALADLRAQVANISIELAEKIVERSIDRTAQEQLIESYIASVG